MTAATTDAEARTQDPMAVLLTLGRVLLGACFVLDGGWWLYTWDVRAGYLARVGAPPFVIVPIAAVFIACGGLVAVGRAVRPAALLLIATAILIALVLHTDFGTGGIGEYPPHTHAQINAKTILVQLALVGSLVLVSGIPRPGFALDPRAVLVGRVVTGGYFVANALWQTLYFQTRVEHVEASGGNPDVIPVAIALQLVFGALIVGGRLVRVSTVPIAIVTLASTVMVHGDLSPGAAYVPNQQVHQWFVKSAIVTGLVLLFALGPMAAPGRASRVSESGGDRKRGSSTVSNS